MNLGTAFKNFFKGQKSGRKVGYPKFKSKRRSKTSFYVSNDKFTVKGHQLKLPHTGHVNMAEKLRFQGKIMSARISRRADWWYVSITVEMPDVKPIQRPGAVGIDLGILRLATLSEGTVLENQKPLRRLLSKVKRLNKALSRKQKGSQNREKVRRQLARLHRRIGCIRDDVLHKATTKIADDFGFVGIETLNVKGMMQNHALALSLGDAALGRFKNLLDSKVLLRGGKVQSVGRFYPSSKTCSGCNAVRESLALSERIYVCPECGLNLDRDLNAALNILAEALRLSDQAS
jgi:putative transposase